MRSFLEFPTKPLAQPSGFLRGMRVGSLGDAVLY